MKDIITVYNIHLKGLQMLRLIFKNSFIFYCFTTLNHYINFYQSWSPALGLIFEV